MKTAIAGTQSCQQQVSPDHDDNNNDEGTHFQVDVSSASQQEVDMLRSEVERLEAEIARMRAEASDAEKRQLIGSPHAESERLQQRKLQVKPRSDV